MSQRSGRAATPTAGSTSSRSSDDEAAAASRPSLKRKSVEPSPPSTSPPASPPHKHPPVALPPPEAGGAGVPRPRPEQDHTKNGDDDEDCDDEASIAALGVKLFPDVPPKSAAAMWVRFVNNAKICIKHYNNRHQANFVYKHAPATGFVCVLEQDGSCYYHVNFLACSKDDGHSQLFFGEIKASCREPEEEDVTCCCPVSPSDAGGKGIRTIEEAAKHAFPNW